MAANKEMKDFIKDYGAVFVPTMAFGLGVFAIYIKFFIDKNLEARRSNKKLLKSSNPYKFVVQKLGQGV